MNETQTQDKPGVLKGLLSDLGITDKDKKFLRDTIKDVAIEAAKDELFGRKRKRDIPITKLHKHIDAVVDAIKSVWYIPALMALSLGFTAIILKWFYSFMIGGP